MICSTHGTFTHIYACHTHTHIHTQHGNSTSKIFKELYNNKVLKAAQLYFGILTCEGLLCFPEWKTLGKVTAQEKLSFPFHLKYNSLRSLKIFLKNLEGCRSFQYLLVIKVIFLLTREVYTDFSDEIQ